MSTDYQPERDQISEAVMAIRQLPVPEGPSSETISNTLAALRATEAQPKTVQSLRPTDAASWVVRTTVLLGLAAAVLLMCFSFSNSGGSAAFAQAAEKLRQAVALSYDTSITHVGQQEPYLKYHTTYIEPGIVRTDTRDNISIVDHRSGKMITLNDTLKCAFVTVAKSGDRSAFAGMQNQIEFLRSLVGRSAKPLGEKDLDGQKVKGFECEVVNDLKYTIWVNAATGDPVRVEYLTKFGIPDAVVTESNFKLNEPVDPAMFDMNPPDGYKVVKNPPVDMQAILQFTPAQNAVEILRAFAKNPGDEFPKHIDDWGEVIVKVSQGKYNDLAKEAGQRLGALSGGYLFSHKSGADYAYLPGGKLGEKDRVVFWYRDDKTGEYSAVYGDLRIEKVDESQLPKSNEKSQK